MELACSCATARSVGHRTKQGLCIGQKLRACIWSRCNSATVSMIRSKRSLLGSCWYAVVQQNVSVSIKFLLKCVPNGILMFSFRKDHMHEKYQVQLLLFVLLVSCKQRWIKLLNFNPNPIVHNIYKPNYADLYFSLVSMANAFVKSCTI